MNDLFPVKPSFAPRLTQLRSAYDEAMQEYEEAFANGAENATDLHDRAVKLWRDLMAEEQREMR